MENRRSRTGSNCGRSFCIQCRLERLAAGATDSHRVEMPNGTGSFRNFQIFKKKEQPREVGRNFRDEFLETFCSIIRF